MMRRLSVPGVIDLVPCSARAVEIELGPLAGWGLPSVAITDWKNIYHFAVLEDLAVEARCRLFGALEPEWRALAGQGPPRRPMLLELIRNTKVMLVSSTDGRDLGRAGDFDLHAPTHRWVSVQFQRNAEDYFACTLHRGRQPLASVSGAMAHFSSGGSREERARNLVRAVTGGLLDASQIAAAFALADVADLDAWERLLKQPDPHEGLAREMAETLRAAQADDVSLPGNYGRAVRVRTTAWTLAATAPPSLESLEPAVSPPEGTDTLQVPSSERWTAEVELESVVVPLLPRRRPLRRGLHSRRSKVLLVVGLVLLLPLFGLVLGMLQRRLGEACVRGGECLSGTCLAGYCSKSCTSNADCGALTCLPLPFDGPRMCQRR